MAENVYLRNRREEYEQLQKAIRGLQAQANEAQRDLTSEELRSITDMGERSASIYSEIELLTENELRTAQVESMADRLTQARKAPGGSDNEEKRSDQGGAGGNGTGDFERLGGARTKDRDPGIYRRYGQYSYVADHWRAKQGDSAAAERLTKHTNANRDNEELRDITGTTGGQGVGLVPPVWLAQYYAEVLHRRLRVASRLRQVPFSGPYPWTIPVAGTGAALTLNTSGDGTPGPPGVAANPTETDPTYTTVTVLPRTLASMTDVTRQLLEASNPSVDSIVMTDLLGAFYDQAETEAVSAIENAASINSVTVADGAVVAGSRKGILDAIGAIEDNGGGDADLIFMKRARWHRHLLFVDSGGRPLVVNQAYGPGNVQGLGDATSGFASGARTLGSLEGLDVVTTPSVQGTADGRAYVVNSQEILFSVSSPMQFNFEQPVGPGAVRIGVWGYMACVAARRPKAIARIVYTTN